MKALCSCPGRMDIREKMYKCMRPGCTKSYLNPNGLKYHTLKGTCTFAEKPNNAATAPAPAQANGNVTPISTTPAGSAPGTPAPSGLGLSGTAPVQLPVPFAIPSLGADQQQQMQQAFAQGFPTFNVSGVPIIAAPMPPQPQQAIGPVPVGMTV